MQYKIVRMYFNSGIHKPRVVRRGLTLEEAQEHCSDPETSSRTCTGYVARKRTEKCGPWFDSYTADK